MTLCGESIQNSDHFIRTVGSAPVEDEIVATVWRAGRSLEAGMKLRRREIAAMPARESQRLRWRGLLQVVCRNRAVLTTPDRSCLRAVARLPRFAQPR